MMEIEQKVTGIIINNVVYKVETTKDKEKSPCMTCDLYELCALDDKFHDFCYNMLTKSEGFIKVQ